MNLKSLPFDSLLEQYEGQENKKQENCGRLMFQREQGDDSRRLPDGMKRNLDNLPFGDHNPFIYQAHLHY